MIRGSSSCPDSTWDEATIHELLGPESAHMYSLKPVHAVYRPAKCMSDSDAVSVSTNCSDSLPASPQTRRKRSHRKVSPKEKAFKCSEIAVVRIAAPIPPIEASQCSIRNLVISEHCDQTHTIQTIDAEIKKQEEEMPNWPSPQPGKKNAYGAYSLQQKKEILAQLQGRIASIESSIGLARDALEKIIQFM